METRLQQLGVLVRRERIRLEMKSQPALAEAAKISPRKVSDVERGITAGPKTYDAIEAVLRWPAGSMQAYLDGGEAPSAGRNNEPVSAEPQKPVLSDEEIIAADSRALAFWFIELVDAWGKNAAEDQLRRALDVRKKARAAESGTLTAEM